MVATTEIATPHASPTPKNPRCWPNSRFSTVSTSEHSKQNTQISDATDSRPNSHMR